MRWFGNRYVLRVPPRRPFTAHEVRFARAIGSVLESRFRAILNPQLMVERAGLFRGAIEDRYVGAFFDGTPYSPRADGGRSERVAEVLEMLRVAALSSYENQPISTGVLLLEGDADPIGAYPAAERDWPHYTGALTSIKSFFRLADGLRTVFLVARDGRLLDIVDIGRWGWASVGIGEADAPCARAYAAHAAATRSGPARLHRAEPEPRDQGVRRRRAGVHVPQRRLAPARPAGEVRDVGGGGRAAGAGAPAVPDRARSRRRARRRAVRRAAPPDRVAAGARRRPGSARHGAGGRAVGSGHAVAAAPAARAGRTQVTDLDASVLEALATLDGAVVTEPGGQLLAVGAILRHPQGAVPSAEGVTEGARTTAAMAASRYGPVLKVSEDGMITFFDGGRVWDI